MFARALNSRLKDLLGAVTRVKKKKKKLRAGIVLVWQGVVLTVAGLEEGDACVKLTNRVTEFINSQLFGPGRTLHLGVTSEAFWLTKYGALSGVE